MKDIYGEQQQDISHEEPVIIEFDFCKLETLSDVIYIVKQNVEQIERNKLDVVCYFLSSQNNKFKEYAALLSYLQDFKSSIKGNFTLFIRGDFPFELVWGLVTLNPIISEKSGIIYDQNQIRDILAWMQPEQQSTFLSRFNVYYKYITSGVLCLDELKHYCNFQIS